MAASSLAYIVNPEDSDESELCAPIAKKQAMEARDVTPAAAAAAAAAPIVFPSTPARWSADIGNMFPCPCVKCVEVRRALEVALSSTRVGCHNRVHAVKTDFVDWTHELGTKTGYPDGNHICGNGTLFCCIHCLPVTYKSDRWFCARCEITPVPDEICRKMNRVYLYDPIKQKAISVQGRRVQLRRAAGEKFQARRAASEKVQFPAPIKTQETGSQTEPIPILGLSMLTSTTM